MFNGEPGREFGPLCYTFIMFIHRTTITGCSSRGAWPWRKPQLVRS
jgi:hypothetical protein